MIERVLPFSIGGWDLEDKQKKEKQGEIGE
jgi:hypothetical protein